jgi:hypothetical protein
LALRLSEGLGHAPGKGAVARCSPPWRAPALSSREQPTRRVDRPGSSEVAPTTAVRCREQPRCWPGAGPIGCWICRTVAMRGLTFELSGRQRQDARARLAKMYCVPPTGPWWPAVGAPLERGVRHQFARQADRVAFAWEPFCFPLRATARAVAVLRVCGACRGLCMALCALQRVPPR